MRLRRTLRLTTHRVEDKLPTDRVDNTAAALIALTYELLDAHADTTRLATDDATDGEWRNHLRYLRDLQRVGREAIARVDSSQGQPGASLRSAA